MDGFTLHFEIEYNDEDITDPKKIINVFGRIDKKREMKSPRQRLGDKGLDQYHWKKPPRIDRINIEH